MINTHLLELSLSRTNFHGSKGVRAIEVLLYYINLDTNMPELSRKTDIKLRDGPSSQCLHCILFCLQFIDTFLDCDIRFSDLLITVIG